MILKNINHNYSYDMQKLCTVFFPFEKIKSSGEDNIEIITEADGSRLCVFVRFFEKEIKKEAFFDDENDMSGTLSVLLYKALSELTGFKPPWGILYGVRPAKLMRRLSGEIGEIAARAHFIENCLVTAQKTDLTAEVMHREEKIISLSSDKSFSLYVSIPFCPTRCSYCSFVSHSIERTHKLLEPYVALLLRELKCTGQIAKKLGLRLETVYFGGGTPTTLSAAQLKSIFEAIDRYFDLSSLREYTVEAGRPDTVTEEKLVALREAGVGRISINPQSFNDKVLEAIGRRHTGRQTEEAFKLAVKYGFDNINMDLIAGLPKDDLTSFKNSVDTAISLKAQSVTVHTLAMKSASYMVTDRSSYDLSDKLVSAEMVDYSDEKLKDSNYYPYYMYRQSKSVGNLENVGWCKDGCDCLYNVYMMDETHSVFAVGAGAVTRLKNPDNGKIERIYNFKYPYEYIDRFEELIARKALINDFYTTF